MNQIRASVIAPSDAGRLYPRYDANAGVLALESGVRREWPFGVDVDGNIVFDLDQDRVLASFDLHIGRQYWGNDLSMAWPIPSEAGSLVFDEETVLAGSFCLPIEVNADRTKTRLQICIGTKHPDKLVSLSPKCVAMMAQDELVGFHVREFVITSVPLTAF